MSLKNAAEEYLAKAEPALAAHQEINDLTQGGEIPEAIKALGRASVWKRQPELWQETLESKIQRAAENLAMADRFLAASTHIPCGLFSLVSNRIFQVKS